MVLVVPFSFIDCVVNLERRRPVVFVRSDSTLRHFCFLYSTCAAAISIAVSTVYFPGPPPLHYVCDMTCHLERHVWCIPASLSDTVQDGNWSEGSRDEYRQQSSIHELWGLPILSTFECGVQWVDNDRYFDFRKWKLL